jgi:hypothetical protein
MFLAIFLPLAIFTYVSNLPATDPELPQAIKELGYSAVDGRDLESLIANDESFSEFGQKPVIACPTVTVLSESEPTLCGYCKFEDAVVYPFWTEGNSRKIKAAPYDYRYIYVDHLHKRFVMLTHSDSKVFELSERRSEWRESFGKWFVCRSAEQLDINAYVEVLRDSSAQNKLKVSFKVLNYATLEVVRDQIRLPEVEAKP